MAVGAPVWVWLGDVPMWFTPGRLLAALGRSRRSGAWFPWLVRGNPPLGVLPPPLIHEIVADSAAFRYS
jgi:hypothetical protein